LELVEDQGERLSTRSSRPSPHWLDFGFDGGRVDALHFAYRFGNGQLASGDEPGEEYVKALGAVFASRGALAVAEAFEARPTTRSSTASWLSTATGRR